MAELQCYLVEHLFSDFILVEIFGKNYLQHSYHICHQPPVSLLDLAQCLVVILVLLVAQYKWS